MIKLTTTGSEFDGPPTRIWTEVGKGKTDAPELPDGFAFNGAEYYRIKDPKPFMYRTMICSETTEEELRKIIDHMKWLESRDE